MSQFQVGSRSIAQHRPFPQHPSRTTATQHSDYPLPLPASPLAARAPPQPRLSVLPPLKPPHRLPFYRLLPDKMAAAARWAALGLALWLCAAAHAEEPEGKRRAGPAKKKDIRDYNDADMARLLEQWEVRGGAGGPRWGLRARPEERPLCPSTAAAWRSGRAGWGLGAAGGGVAGGRRWGDGCRSERSSSVRGSRGEEGWLRGAGGEWGGGLSARGRRWALLYHGAVHVSPFRKVFSWKIESAFKGNN